MGGDGTFDHAEKVRANLVGAALVGGVTACALLEDGFAGCSIGACQERGNRGFCSSSGLGAGFTFGSALGNDRKAFLLRNRRVENTFRRDGYCHQDENGAKKSTNAHVHI